MSRLVLDPTAERSPSIRERLPRLDSLDGRTVGLLDISKPRGDLFLDRIEQRLRERGAEVIRYRKPTFTKPAPVDLRQQIAVQCEAVVEALADWGSCTSCSVHDTVDLEARGLPSVFVATIEFVDGAAVQSRALGADPAAVYVEHPIQDRSDAEMLEIADRAADEVLANLVRSH